MFENLTSRLDQAFKTLKGHSRINEINIANTVKEVRRALLEADVNYKIAKNLTDEIKQEALGGKVLISVTPGQLFVKIVKEKITELMGGMAVDINTKGSPAVILIAGLQGSGKTTFTAKLANMLKKKGNQVLLSACDIYRPAAIDQLKTLGEQIAVDVYADPENKNVLNIATNTLRQAKDTGKNIVIVDTAGRLAVDEAMMEEITTLKQKLQPSETLFVVDSMTGQDAVYTAKTFNDRLDFDGVVLTKMDGDTRGGAALSIKALVNKPIKFISTGEKPDTIDVFHPERMASRILGMGDIVTLVEKAEQAFDNEEGRKLEKKLTKNRFDFNDLYAQMKKMKKMGGIKDLIGMIPGMDSNMKNMYVDENRLIPMEAAINSMTPEEREQPQIINNSRKKRIAVGSGTSVQEVNNLIKQLDQIKKMVKKMNKMDDKKTRNKKQKRRR